MDISDDEYRKPLKSNWGLELTILIAKIVGFTIGFFKGLTCLGLANMVLYQWFFVRLSKRVADIENSSGEKKRLTLGYKFLTGILPLSGWRNKYLYWRKVPGRELDDFWPVKKSHAHDTLKGWPADEEKGTTEVADLAITRLNYPDGSKGVASIWKTYSLWERIKFLFHGEISFNCVGVTHPPVYLKIGDWIENQKKGEK